MIRDPDPDDIDDVIELLEDNARWSVDDWDYEVGRYQDGTLAIGLEWDPLSELDGNVRSLLKQETLAQIEGEQPDSGKPRAAIVEGVVSGVGVDECHVDAMLRQLRQNGEIYEPVEDRYRRV